MYNLKLLQKNQIAEIISTSIIVDELKKIIDTKLDYIFSISKIIHKRNPKNIVFVGSGNSWSTMYSGKYLISKFSALPCELFFGPELITINPNFIDQDTLAILASYSGTTEDTLNALDYLKNRGTQTISITNKNNSTLATKTDFNLNYDSKSLYISALFELFSFVSSFLNLRKELDDYNKFQNDLIEIPSKIELIMDKSKASAKKLANELGGVRHVLSMC